MLRYASQKLIMNKILRINTRTNDIRSEDCSSEMLHKGGRSLIAHIVLNEVDPNCDAMGRKNKFILAAGLLGDTNVTTAGRYSIGGKSPLTGGVKEANVGGVPVEKWLVLASERLFLRTRRTTRKRIFCWCLKKRLR